METPQAILLAFVLTLAVLAWYGGGDIMAGWNKLVGTPAPTDPNSDDIKDPGTTDPVDPVDPVDIPDPTGPEMGSIDGFTDKSALSGTIFKNGPCLTTNSSHNYIYFGTVYSNGSVMYAGYNAFNADAGSLSHKVVQASVSAEMLPNNSGIRIGSDRCVSAGIIMHSDAIPDTCATTLPEGYRGWVYKRDADGFCGERLK